MNASEPDRNKAPKLLCRPLVCLRIELAQSRIDYQKRQTEGQDEAVENDLLKDQDKRMPMKFERSSKNFGGTKK